MTAEKFPILSLEQVRLSQVATGKAHRRSVTVSRADCAGVEFCRVVCSDALSLLRSWHPGPDALVVAQILRARGLELPQGTTAQVGDLMVWACDLAPRGIMGIRVIGKRVIGYSVEYATRVPGALCFWPFDSFEPGYRVYRLWKP